MSQWIVIWTVVASCYVSGEPINNNWGNGITHMNTLEYRQSIGGGSCVGTAELKSTVVHSEQELKKTLLEHKGDNPVALKGKNMELVYFQYGDMVNVSDKPFRD